MKRINRVKKHQEFTNIIHKNKPIKSEHFVVYFQKKEENLTRVGIGVSKKNGNAVKRNRIKRQIRAITNSYLPLNTTYDIIIIVRTSYKTNEFANQANELIEIFKKIGDKKIEKEQ